MHVIWPVLVVEARVSETFAPSNTGIPCVSLRLRVPAV